jgi:nucleoside-diphosphate-sugar epimerase
MKNVIITGTNGMIGGLILQYCLQRDDVESVTSVTRKSLGIQHPKLKEVIHQNFEDFSPISAQLQQQDICFFCIGVYTGAVPRDEFRRITVDVTAAFAKTLKESSPGCSFCFLSGQGADSTEKSRIMFAKDKGIAENILIRTGFRQLAIFRPGYIYPVTPRKEPNLQYVIFRWAYRYLLRFVYPGIGLSSEQLATAMINIGINGGNQVIYENNEIKQFADARTG